LAHAAVFCLFVGISVCWIGCSKDPKPADKAVSETIKKTKKAAGKTDSKEQGRDSAAPKPDSAGITTHTRKADQVAAAAAGSSADSDKSVDKSGDKGTEPAGKVVGDVKGGQPAEAGKTGETGKPAEAGKPTEAGKTVEAARPAETAKTAGPATQKAAAAPAPDPSRPVLSDPRLLLTLADIEKVAPAKAKFRRSPLPGVPRTEDTDSIFYTPEKGNTFGFALQLFRSKNAQDTKKRFETFQASYPSAQEIASVSGKTFFSYWDEVLHIGFVHPAKNLVVIMSCGRSFCDGEKLMELATKVSERLK
jgi:hypothetical protein